MQDTAVVHRGASVLRAPSFPRPGACHLRHLDGLDTIAWCEHEGLLGIPCVAVACPDITRNDLPLNEGKFGSDSIQGAIYGSNHQVCRGNWAADNAAAQGEDG